MRTEQGDEIECEVVVNCAGQWAHAVGAMLGTTVPLHSAEHFYVVTEAVEGTHPDLPIMRDPDGWTYFKEEVGGLVVGGFEPEAKPWRAPDDLPYPFEFQLLEEDWEHFSVLMDEAAAPGPGAGRDRDPEVLQRARVVHPRQPVPARPDPGGRERVHRSRLQLRRHRLGRAEPGGRWRSGSSRGSRPPTWSGWTYAGSRRSTPTGSFLRDRVAEVLGLHYAVPWPNLEVATARDVRLSPLHERLRDAGAVFGSKMGWERANVFAPTPDSGLEYSWERPTWLPWSVAEQTACRRDVAVFDQTSFSKYVVDGSDALAALQWVCAADVDVEVGRAVYTPFLNERGTYEADVTVTRTGEDAFQVLSSSATTIRDLDWIRRHTGATRGTSPATSPSSA